MQPNEAGPRRMRRDPGYPPRNRLGRLFYEDGCVRRNIAHKEYVVVFAPDCPHTKVRASLVVVSAENSVAAQHYAEQHLMPAQAHVAGVMLAPANGFRVVPA